MGDGHHPYQKAHRASMSLCDEPLFFFSCNCNTYRASDVIIIYLWQHGPEDDDGGPHATLED